MERDREVGPRVVGMENLPTSKGAKNKIRFELNDVIGEKIKATNWRPKIYSETGKDADVSRIAYSKRAQLSGGRRQSQLFPSAVEEAERG